MRIVTRWYTDGFAGFVDRLGAPRMLRRVYRAELNLLDRYTRDTPAPVSHGRDAARGGVALVQDARPRSRFAFHRK
ncbi:MAG: hypothetical protein ABIZ57_08020 [Candidatus Limnocylindria bacterium]